jgi:hypothetical protein
MTRAAVAQTIWTEMLSIWQNRSLPAQVLARLALAAGRILPRPENLSKWVPPTSANPGHPNQLWQNRRTSG